MQWIIYCQECGNQNKGKRAFCSYKCKLKNDKKKRTAKRNTQFAGQIIYTKQEGAGKIHAARGRNIPRLPNGKFTSTKKGKKPENIGVLPMDKPHFTLSILEHI